MKINGLTGSQQLNVINISNLLKNADIGDVLHVQITGISSKALSLRLPDGSIISAASMVPLEVNIGDFLDLSIRTRDESQVFVEIVNGDMGENLKDANIKDKLLSLNIAPDLKSIQVGREMLKNDLTLTKESFQDTIKLLSKFSNSTVDKLTFLMGNSIPVNSKNINSIDQLSQHKQMLGQNLEKLITHLGQLVETVSKIESDRNLNSVVNNKMQSPQKNDTVDNNSTEYNNINQKNISAGNINKEDSINRSEIKMNQNQIGFKYEHIVSEDIPKSSMAKSIQSIPKKSIPEQNAISKNIIIDNKLELDTHTGTELKTELENIHRNVKNLFKVIDKTCAEKLPEQINGEKVVKEIREVLKNLLSCNIAADTDESRQLTSIVTEIEESLNFMNQISRFYHLIHIPININHYDSTVELYIFKDGKNKKKIDPANTSIFVSLDTANLGLVEALINVTNKNLECLFQTDEKETLQFIKKNVTHLYNLLDVYGYKLVKVNYKEIEERTDLINIRQTKNRHDKKYSFDMRV
ncbi:MAG: flagellar hook-length control protein FliK [Clostridia bacterium]